VTEPGIVPPALFRGYDLRGRAADGLTDVTARWIGRAIGRYVGGAGSTVYLGRDNRASSGGLAAAIREGLVGEGCEVRDLGMVPTPIVYAASTADAGSFGVSVTASHLPADWNGVKLCRGSRPVHTDAFRPFVEDAGLGGGVARGSAVDASGLVPGLVDRLVAGFERSALRVVVDAQNGAGSILGPEIVGRLAADVVKLHTDPAAPYPYRTPDPQVGANLARLGEVVRASGAALGVAFDGDADRLGVVDELGRFVPADFITALLARAAVRGRPGAAVVVDVLTSDVVRAVVEAEGGTVVDWKSGHAFIQERMREIGAVLAGEGSGHIFFPAGDGGEGYDDGIYAACRVIDLVARSGSTLSALVAGLPRFHMTAEARPHCADDVKRDVVATATDLLRADGLAVDDTDGAKVRFARGWGIIRAANTEPALSLRFEADDEGLVAEYERIVWQAVDRAAATHGVTLAR
jgi:phosphomannomutase